MAKKVLDSQVAGIKAHAEAKNKETIDKVNKAIDKLKRKNKPINFETVCKEAGVSRATLYNNAQLKERILSYLEKFREPSRPLPAHIWNGKKRHHISVQKK